MSTIIYRQLAVPTHGNIMDLALFQSYATRINEATRFVQLVDIDSELEKVVGRLPAATIEFLKEEVELRSNATVYTAIMRLQAKASLLGTEPVMPVEFDEEHEDLSLNVMDHIKGTDPLASARLEDDEELDKMVESLSKKIAGKPFEEASSNMTMAHLLARPGFMEEIEQAEAEERGEFPGKSAVMSKVLHDLARCDSPSGVAMVVQAVQDSGLPDQLSSDEATLFQERVRERMAITGSAAGNAHMIAQRRRARSMGMTLDELMGLKQREIKQDAPVMLRSFLETLRDETPELRQILDSEEEPSEEAMRRIRDKIQEGIHRRIRDSKAADDLIRAAGSSPPNPPKIQ